MWRCPFCTVGTVNVYFYTERGSECWTRVFVTLTTCLTQWTLLKKDVITFLGLEPRYYFANSAFGICFTLKDLTGGYSMQYWTRLFMVLKLRGCSISVVCSPNQDTMSLILVGRMCYACSKGATPQLYKMHGSFQFNGGSCVLLHAGWHGPSTRVFSPHFFLHWLYIVHKLCLMFCNTKDCNIFFLDWRFFNKQEKMTLVPVCFIQPYKTANSCSYLVFHSSYTWSFVVAHHITVAVNWSWSAKRYSKVCLNGKFLSKLCSTLEPNLKNVLAKLLQWRCHFRKGKWGC